MSSRKIEDLVPELQTKFPAFKAKMAEAGIPFMITCTARIVREQIALYSQGREKVEATNVLRKMAGMAPISWQENSKKVTWTLASKHIIDLDDNNPDNDKSRAFDIAITRDGRPCWEPKINVNKNDLPDYTEAGRIGEAAGLRWGGRFPSPDPAHFEV